MKLFLKHKIISIQKDNYNKTEFFTKLETILSKYKMTYEIINVLPSKDIIIILEDGKYKGTFVCGLVSLQSKKYNIEQIESRDGELWK